MVRREELRLTIEAIKAELTDMHHELGRIADRLPSFITSEEYDRRHQPLLDSLNRIDTRLTSIEATNQAAATTRQERGSRLMAAIGAATLLVFSMNVALGVFTILR